MAESHDLGEKGEALAVKHLADRGFRIMARNWTWGKHEIDIIAEKDDTVVFAEVKTRSDNYMIPPATAVNKAKQKSLILAAEGYIKRYNVNLESRFDIITVVKSDSGFEIEHIEDAFYPTLR
ncbi:MAG TPA: YraN family protein [Bacteroidales bacterium]|nr:YraN family protein [Bacteroidales bacterium]